MPGARPVVLMHLVLVLVLGIADAAADQPGWDFQSRAAQAAKRKFEDAAAKAEQEYARRLNVARETAVKEFNDALRAATRAGDLDEANRVKAAIAELNEDAPVANQGPLGRWVVRYSNGVTRETEIRPDGTVAWVDGDRKRGQGRLQRIGGGWLLPDDGNGNAERMVVTADRLYVEHFHPASHYPKEGTRTFAVGTRSPGRSP